MSIKQLMKKFFLNKLPESTHSGAALYSLQSGAKERLHGGLEVQKQRDMACMTKDTQLPREWSISKTASHIDRSGRIGSVHSRTVPGTTFLPMRN